jgi:hypothetical protein
MNAVAWKNLDLHYRWNILSATSHSR